MICSLALALGLDASSSMSDPQWRMQVEGTAAAIMSPEVVASVNAIAPIRVHVFAWAGEQAGGDWIDVRSGDDLAIVAAAVRGLNRAHAGVGTATGAAMLYAASELRQQPCRRRVLDLSGDGRGNGKPTAAEAAEQINIPGDVTINGVGIGAEGETAFTDAMVGPGSFTLHAKSFEDFSRVLVTKLLAEMVS